MPSNHSLIVAPEAEDDLRQILQYTLEMWGKETRNRCAARFDRAFDRLRMFPESGAQRGEVGRQVRCVIVGQHLVFYQTDGAIVSIRRVVSQRAGEFPVIFE